MSTSRSASWLITPAQLARALRMQAVGGGVLENVNTPAPFDLSTAGVIDGSIETAVEQAVDRLASNHFSAYERHAIEFESLRRTLIEDLLDPDVAPSPTIDGRAVLVAGAERSPVFAFSMDAAGATIDETGADELRRWLDHLSDRPAPPVEQTSSA